MADKDLYAILGVTKSASTDEIKKAYRRLARQYHPDRNPDDAAAEARFKEISAAHAVLSDEKKRKLYDEFGPDGLRDGFDADSARTYQQWAGRFGQRGGPGGFNFGQGGGLGGFGDLDELLGTLFGGGGGGPFGRGRRGPTRGQNTEGELTVSLRHAIDGGEAHLPELGGNVRIPAGIGDGQRIRLAGKGGHGRAGRGDLLLKINIAPPPGYERDGDDLTLDVPMTVAQAVRGGKVEIPTPEGTLITLTVPAGSQSGRKLRIRGRGMPGKGGSRGHLFIRLQVRVPEGDDPALLDLVEQLEAFYDTE